MCRHILNANVYWQASCCGIWIHCPECHEEKVGNDHPLVQLEIVVGYRDIEYIYRYVSLYLHVCTVIYILDMVCTPRTFAV